MGGGGRGGGGGGFFFFKQKTAYEMCGRDWSSDGALPISFRSSHTKSSQIIGETG